MDPFVDLVGSTGGSGVLLQLNCMQDADAQCEPCLISLMSPIIYFHNSGASCSKRGYSQLSLRRTPLGPVLCVRLREKPVL